MSSPLLLASLLFAIVPKVVPVAKQAPADELAAMSGAWIVTMSGSPSASNCQAPEKEPEGLTFIWLVSTHSDGRVAVSVQGQTNYPDLYGTYSKDGLVVDGGAANWEGWVIPISFHNLQRKQDGTLEGFRRYLTLEPAPYDPNILVPCFIDRTVTAKKQ